MKILLLQKDIYLDFDSEKLFYQRLIEKTKGDHFYYYTENESSGIIKKPTNAEGIEFQHSEELYFPKNRALQSSFDFKITNQLCDFAYSVKGQEFDIIEVSDIVGSSSLVMSIFEKFNIGYESIVITSQGLISSTAKTDNQPNTELTSFGIEDEEFDAAHITTEILISKLKNNEKSNTYFLNPLGLLELNKFSHIPSASMPDLCFFSDRGVGNNSRIALELIRYLPRKSYKRLHFIVSNDYLNSDQNRVDVLETMSENRDLKDFISPLKIDRQKGLLELWESNNVFLLPTKSDAIDIFALEAILNGCVTVIPSSSGTSIFLDKYFPGIPYLKFDLGNLYSCVSDMVDLLENFSVVKNSLHNFLDTCNNEFEAIDMTQFYRFIALRSYDFDKIQKLDLIERERVPTQFPIKSRYSSKQELTELHQHLDELSSQQETTNKDILKKIKLICTPPGDQFFYRVWFWKELARLEGLVDNKLFSICYMIRIIRSLGYDKFGFLPSLKESLGDLGLREIEVSVSDMYDRHDKNSVFNRLVERYGTHKLKPELPYDTFIDRRSDEKPKISIIVSLYNAESKIEFFLTALSHQTLQKDGLVEYIFQDSCSPTNELKEIEKFDESNDLNYVYCRSLQRETIQCAWNRGVSVSRAPYLVFLGVDEGLYPDALETLANYLDENQNVDWVMSSSLVMEVDETGVIKYDSRKFDRAGVHKDYVYLDTCYLTWVGGMYRKSIHNSYGYFDETYKGAGDTEFKLRILPKINAYFLPETLGVFYNYPEERTTASPHVEIEDLRAWYMHRSYGGVKYAFIDRPIEDIKGLLMLCLGYKKSYKSSLSTDFDLALSLAKYGLEREESDWWCEIYEELLDMQKCLIQIESTFNPELLTTSEFETIQTKFKHKQTEHSLRYKDLATPCYKIFNDNRFEQHYWYWKSF